MVLLTKPNGAPGGGEEFLLGLANFHVATTIGPLFIKFLSLSWFHFIITAKCQTYSLSYLHNAWCSYMYTIPIRLLLILEVLHKFIVEHDGVVRLFRIRAVGWAQCALVQYHFCNLCRCYKPTVNIFVERLLVGQST